MLTDVREYSLGLWQSRSIFPLSRPFFVAIKFLFPLVKTKLMGDYLVYRQCARRTRKNCEIQIVS
jgi:hypothetical protein